MGGRRAIIDAHPADLERSRCCGACRYRLSSRVYLPFCAEDGERGFLYEASGVMGRVMGRVGCARRGRDTR